MEKENKKPKYKLITRNDFDGIVCAMLLKSIGVVEEIMFAHPKDVQDEKVDVSGGVITANLPYVNGVHMAFDHHLSEVLRVGRKDKHVIDPCALSAARVVYNYYGGAKRFTNINPEILDAVDKADSANYTEEEILNPSGWVLLNFIMDPRTGVGRFSEFNRSNSDVMRDLIDICKDTPIERIMELPDIKERTEMYFAHQKDFESQLRKCTKIHSKLAIIDLRNEEIIYTGNRFLIYALYPDVNVSMHIIWGKEKKNTVFAVGKSIINRTSSANIGELMLKYGGGGHIAAGTCQVDNGTAEEIKDILIEEITEDG